MINTLGSSTASAINGLLTYIGNLANSRNYNNASLKTYVSVSSATGDVYSRLNSWGNSVNSTLSAIKNAINNIKNTPKNSQVTIYKTTLMVNLQRTGQSSGLGYAMQGYIIGTLTSTNNKVNLANAQAAIDAYYPLTRTVTVYYTNTNTNIGYLNA